MTAVWSHWWWAVIGAALHLGGLLSWWRHSDDEISRMRREQELGTAVIPAEPDPALVDLAAGAGWHPTSGDSSTSGAGVNPPLQYVSPARGVLA